MYISKTPFRVSFFGGGTDFPEFFTKKKAKVIGTTINKYLYITKNFFNSLDNSNIKLFYSRVESVKKSQQIKHKVIREIFEKLKIKDQLELHFISDLPSFSGLGSSSSFSAGLINLLSFVNNNKELEKNKLAKFTIDFERNTLKESVGYQDQIFASYGGFNSISFTNNDFKVKNYSLNEDIKKIEQNSFLVHSGIKRKADNIEKEKIKKILNNNNHLKKISNIADEADYFLKNGELSKNFSRLMKLSWSIKKKLHIRVSNSHIEKLYNKGLEFGADCGKLLGAGDGGFLYFHVPKKNQKYFLSKFKNAIKINFSNHGSKILSI